MHAFAASITLFLTILLSFVFAAIAGYAAIWGILRALGEHSRQQPKPARTAEQAGD